MKLFKISLITIFVLLLSACNDEAQTVVKETPSFEQLKKMESANYYTLKTIEGKEIKLKYDNSILTSEQLNGKITLINFFATWCPPCKEEIPVFNKLVKKYPNDFQIISVLFQDQISMEDLKKFIKDNNIEFTVTVGDENLRLAKDINNIQKVPESYLFTKDGVLLDKYFGAINEKNFTQTLENLRGNK